MPEDPAARLAEVLQGAIDLLRDAAFSAPTEGNEPAEDATLLHQCLLLCEEQDALQTEPVRTVHHFACTGGSLISKCLAALPNVQLLSELDPLSTHMLNPGKPRFAPTDLVLQLRQSSRGVPEQLIIEIFRTELRLVHQAAVQLGQRLVLRDHAHSHFCVGADVPARLTFRELVQAVFPVRSILTVRHPLDSFASLADNQWLHFSPKDVDEYCRRYLLFLERHDGVPVFRYEDFVSDPKTIMSEACRCLELAYSDGFVDLFSVFRVTGDSGRSTASISDRPRRKNAEQLRPAALESPNFHALCGRLGYEHN